MTHSPSTSNTNAIVINNNSNTSNNTLLANLAATNVGTNVKDSTIAMELTDVNQEDPNPLMIDEGAELPPPLEAQTANTIDTVNTLVNAPPLPTRARILLPSIIIPFSIMGLLIRLGLVSIETFAGQQVFALAWPQFIGCLLMGLFVSTRGWIDGGLVLPSSASKGHWIGAFVYIGLSSGLCGSITTFSSWNLALFNELINTANVSRHPFQNILSALTELVATLALSISGLQLGYHLGEALLQLATNWGLGSRRRSHALSSPITASQPSSILDISPALTPPSPPVPPNRWTILDIVIVSAAIILWTGVICAAILVPRESRLSWRHIVLACCFAPAGAILRWYLSRFNSRSKLFPLGTFAANLGGSIILAAIVCLQHTSAAGGKSTLICHVLSGLQDGFCGCLTTISTFALEIKSLPRRASYVYGVVSVVVTQVFMLLIVGSYMWTRNSDDYVMACTS
ncbi:hypothetical protein BGZ89_011440 [Linnemannia elongata]|nr:hypothetical protein BGZ89_011440 [Linnemannia elongata]